MVFSLLQMQSVLKAWVSEGRKTELIEAIIGGC